MNGRRRKRKRKRRREKEKRIYLSEVVSRDLRVNIAEISSNGINGKHDTKTKGAPLLFNRKYRRLSGFRIKPFIDPYDYELIMNFVLTV